MATVTLDDDGPVMRTMVVVWVFFLATSVFFKQAGFGVMEAGTVRSKNVKSVMLKNLVVLVLSGVGFWLVGYALAFGCDDCDFAGSKFFALSELSTASHVDAPHKVTPSGYMYAFFQFCLACIASSIIGGAVAERTVLRCYAPATLFLNSIIYPVVVHWMWGGGWLQQEGALDFAGGGVVHMVGGCTGLVGTAIIGPRIGRFTGKRFHVKRAEFTPNSPVFQTLGVLIAWTGWFGFTCGGVPRLTGNEGVVELAAINTTLGPAASGVLIVALQLVGSWFSALDFELVLGSVISGLVSISAGAGVMKPWAAAVCGLVGGLVYMLASRLLVQLRVDDAMGTLAAHYFCGAWSLVSVGLFAKGSLLEAAYPDYSGDVGIFYGGSGELLGWQIAAVVVITGWTAALSGALFFAFHVLRVDRVSHETEVYGLDGKHHGGHEKDEYVLRESILRALGQQQAQPQQPAQ